MLDDEDMTLADRGRAARPKRAEKAQEMRRKLFRAAARVVGEQGYAAASVSRITSLAGVAQGTFYTYFKSRQDLLDQLLTELGRELLDFIRARIQGSTSAVDREERQFRAFFDFLIERPEFYRILHEAESYAPEGYKRHMDNLERRYVRALRRDWERGEVPGFDEEELAVASDIMIAAREYLMIRYCRAGNKVRPVPEWVIRAYMKTVMQGVFGTERAEANKTKDGSVSVADPD